MLWVVGSHFLRKEQRVFSNYHTAVPSWEMRLQLVVEPQIQQEQIQLSIYLPVHVPIGSDVRVVIERI